MRLRKQRGNRRRTVERIRRRSFVIRAMVVFLQPREDQGKRLLTGTARQRIRGETWKKERSVTRVAENEGDSDDVVGPTAFMIHTTANCARYFTRTEWSSTL